MVAQHRLALLIDAENISQKWGPEIYRRIVRTQGKPDICRLYGKAKHLQGWDKELKKACVGGYEMRLLHSDNNNADMTLAMDAIDLYRDGIVRFAIASMDGDFACLAKRLRSSRCIVFGLGTRKASHTLRASVNQYMYVGPKTESNAVKIPAQRFKGQPLELQH